jgi:hypothetical protein
VFEVRVEPLDLPKHGLSLCLFPRNRSRGSERHRGSHEDSHETEHKQPRLPLENAGKWAIPGRDWRTGKGPVRHVKRP